MSKSLSVSLIGAEGKEIAKLNFVPIPFLTEYRYDLIKRAVLTELQNMKQPKGVDPLAGKKTTAESWGVGYGIARVPRVKGSGYPKASQGAFAPMTRGGYNPTAPKSNKVIKVKINKKEKRKAFFSAIACTANLNMILKRGHKISNSKLKLPLVIGEEVAKINKTKEVEEFLKKIGIYDDIIRVKDNIKIRAGKGKRRGRRYKERKGPLLVVLGEEPIKNAFKNLPGVDVYDVRNLPIHALAPGCLPGRLTIWTINSYKYLAEKFGYIGELT
jgi:large subunit ribosomal protein L4e